MSKRASDLAARMRQTVSHATTPPAPAEPAARTPAQGEPVEASSPSSWPRPPRRPPTSRYTIDLEHRHRDALRGRALELNSSASAIVRALLDLVEEDPELAARVAQRIEGEG